MFWGPHSRASECGPIWNRVLSKPLSEVLCYGSFRERIQKPREQSAHPAHRGKRHGGNPARRAPAAAEAVVPTKPSQRVLCRERAVTLKEAGMHGDPKGSRNGRAGGRNSIHPPQRTPHLALHWQVWGPQGRLRQLLPQCLAPKLRLLLPRHTLSVSSGTGPCPLGIMIPL